MFTCVPELPVWECFSVDKSVVYTESGINRLSVFVGIAGRKAERRGIAIGGTDLAERLLTCWEFVVCVGISTDWRCAG
jgi:hypothetical protein